MSNKSPNATYLAQMPDYKMSDLDDDDLRMIFEALNECVEHTPAMAMVHQSTIRRVARLFDRMTSEED